MQVSIGIFAHNEERTVGRAIEAFLEQEVDEVQISEILVISCGSTDGTVEIANRFAGSDSRITVVDRAKRQGKVAAINEFLSRAGGDVLFFAGADLVPGPQLVERLVRPMLQDSSCAMTGPRIVTFPGDDVTGRLHSLLWRLHHEVALQEPKLGEIVAVRASFLATRLPSGINCDEVLVEAEVTGRGGRLMYAPDAEVRNFPPAAVRQLYVQRRRIACQHRAAARLLSYHPATAKNQNIIRAVMNVVRREPAALVLLALLGTLELAARAQGFLDDRRGRTYQVWEPVDRDVAFAASSADMHGLKDREAGVQCQSM